jgi:hypothetical protein
VLGGISISGGFPFEIGSMRNTPRGFPDPREDQTSASAVFASVDADFNTRETKRENQLWICATVLKAKLIQKRGTRINVKENFVDILRFIIVSEAYFTHMHLCT